MEAGLARGFELFSERFVLTPAAMYVWDFGYWTKAFDGPNHWQVQLDFAFALSEHWSMFGYYAHSFALEDIKREGLGDGDLDWWGVGLSFEY